MPADPVANIMSRTARGVQDATVTQEMYKNHVKEFRLDQPLTVQFVTYVKNALKGDYGLSFSQYSCKVNDIISNGICGQSVSSYQQLLWDLTTV